MAAEYELTFNDYLAILRRRGVHIVSVFVAIFVVSLVVAIAIPPVYQSTGTILVESQQVPTEMVKATITSFADERIEIIKQRVMTRDNLVRIIEKYGLFKDQFQKRMTTSELVDEMHRTIAITLLSADQGGQKGKATIAFKVSFEYKRPEVAHAVANDLVTLFLDENVKARTARATETTEFLSQEADRLRGELENVENQVATYKQQHANALPEHQELHLSMLQRTEDTLKEIERDYKSTQEELRYLDIELASVKAGIGVRPGQVFAPIPTPASELEKLKMEYTKAVATYKENHPTVRALKRKIESLEKNEPAPAPATTEAEKPKSPSVDPEQELMVAKVQAKIDSANARLTSLSQQQAALRAKMGQLEGQIIQSPQVERGLTALLRDYENAKAKYDEVRSKQTNAKMAENLEQQNKSERFALLEPPLMPDKPIKPNRMKIIAMGFFMAIAGAGGVVMLLESLDKRVRGGEALTALLGVRPLSVIPYITIQSEINRRKHLAKYLLIVITVALFVTMLAVHFLYMPLDILAMKVLARFE